MLMIKCVRFRTAITLLGLASFGNQALSNMSMKCSCDEAMQSSSLLQFGHVVFGLEGSIEVIDTIHTKLTFDPLGCAPPFFGHGLNVAHISKGLDLLELLLGEGAIIKDVGAEDRATLASKET